MSAAVEPRRRGIPKSTSPVCRKRWAEWWPECSVHVQAACRAHQALSRTGYVSCRCDHAFPARGCEGGGDVLMRVVVAALARVLAGSCLVLIAALAAPTRVASAAELRDGNDVVIPADETIDDDLYVGGKTVTIQGVVLGDVVAGAADV